MTECPFCGALIPNGKTLITTPGAIVVNRIRLRDSEGVALPPMPQAWIDEQREFLIKTYQEHGLAPADHAVQGDTIDDYWSVAIDHKFGSDKGEMEIHVTIPNYLETEWGDAYESEGFLLVDFRCLMDAFIDQYDSYECPPKNLLVISAMFTEYAEKMRHLAENA